jgi:sugar fermentation stimulation protein A
MEFTQTLLEGRLLRRYQRFLADVELPDGSRVTAHCPNTGSMMGCALAGSRVWLSTSDNPARKYRHTWELVESDGTLVGIHTGRSNHLVLEAVTSGRLAGLAGYTSLRTEVPYGGVDGRRSRIDLLLAAPDRPPCFVEVKNVTAAVADGIGYFPDAVTARGAKHVDEMAAEVAAGNRAVLVFCVQRDDVRAVRPADHIDPEYGRRLRSAVAAGVEVVAWGAEVRTTGIRLVRQLPVEL